MAMKSNFEDYSRLWNRSERFQWLCAMCAGCSSVYSVRTVMSLCSVAMSKDLGWNKAQTGAVLGSFYWGYALTQILGGYLGDRFGGDVVMITAAVAWSLVGFWTPALQYLSSSPDDILVIMIIARVVMGAFQGVHYPSLTSLLCSRVSEDGRAFAYAASSSGTYMGVLLCGSVGSLLLEWYGWTMPFYVTGMFAMCWLFFMKYNLLIQQRQKDAVLSVNKLSGGFGRQKHKSVPWLKIFKQPPFWAIMIAHVCVMNAWVILSSWSPTYFHENFPGSKGWVFNVVPWILGIVFKIASGLTADHLVSKGYSVTITRKTIEGISCVGCAVFLFALSHATTYEQALFRMTIAIGFIGFHSGAVMVNPQDIAPQFAGSVFGMMNTIGSIPGFVGVYLAGLTLEATGSWSAVFNQAGVVVLIGGVLYLLFGSGRKVV